MIWGEFGVNQDSLCLKVDKYSGKVGSVGRWIVWQLDTAVLWTIVSPAVMVLMGMVLTVVVSAIGVLTTAVLVVSSPRKPWEQVGICSGQCCWMSPCLCSLSPALLAPTGAHTALLPVWAGGSGAGDLCPPLSIQRTLFPCWPRCP